MTPSMWMIVAALLICVALSAFFSASETAYSAANKARFKSLAQSGSKRAHQALKLAEDDERLLMTILIGNSVVNMTAAVLSAVLFVQLLGSYGPMTAVLVATLLILVFGEVSPKAIAREMPERLAVNFAPLLVLFRVILTPFSFVLAQWSKLLSRMFKSEEIESHIEEELISLVDEAQTDGDMDAHEGELIRSAIEFNDDRDIISIMTPRVDVTALEDTMTVDEAASVFRESGYSRVPVYHEDMDHIVGILHEKDFYAMAYRGVTEITAMMKPPICAPSSLKLTKMLKLFQKEKTHMAIVVDEFGGTEGLVTMEDVLEELVGEIYDEHDDVDQQLVHMDDGSYLVEGGMQLSELLDMLDVEDVYSADTVGGWAAEVMGCIPFVGAAFETDELSGMVTQMEKRRVTQLRIRRTEKNTVQTEA